LPPYQHSNPVAVISQHLNAAVPTLADSRPELACLDPVLAAGLAKDRDDRFARCADFANPLREAAGDLANIHSKPTDAAVARPEAHQQYRSAKRDAPQGLSAISQPRLGARTIVTAILATLAVSGIAFLVFRILRNDDGSPAHRVAESSPPAASAASTPPKPQSAGAPPAAVPTTTLPPTATASQPPTDRYAISACYSLEDPPTERPTEVTLVYCGDGGAQLDHMSWTAWGPDGAEGKGYFSVKSCQPDCADGGWLHYPAVIHAANPAPAASNSGCPPDTLFYTDITLAFPTASVPNGTNGMVVNSQYSGMPAIRFTSGQNQSSPSLGPQTCW
jgi:hypothetical protein